MKKIITVIVSVVLYLIPGKSFSQIIFYEGFSGGVQPPGWTNDSLGHAANHIWIFNNAFNRNITGANFNSSFAIFDSDEGGIDDGFAEDASLTTPPISISSVTDSLYLEFDEQFQGDPGGNGGLRILQMSTNGGTSWSVIDSGETSIGFPNPAVHSVYNISSIVPSASLLIRFEFIGSWDWWWAIDNVMIITRNPCSGAPNAGSARSNFSSVCPTDTFYLSLNGNDYATDFLYQWQSSTDTISWTNIPNDTIDAINISQSVPTYYRCKMSCHSQSSYSHNIFVNMNSPVNCYCEGKFVVGCDILNDVTFNNLANLNSDCNGNPGSYINYPDTGVATTSVNAGTVYNLIIASGFGIGNHSGGAWFDFNHNGSFQDAGEFFLISDSIPESSPNFSVPVMIPLTSVGPTRMRVRYIYDNPVVQTDDCTDFDYGETEDYTINILNPALQIENVSAGEISIYPSPASTTLTISTGNLKGRFVYSIYDMQGQLCFSSQDNEGLTRINITAFSRGIYLLRAESDSGVYSKKFIINR